MGRSTRKETTNHPYPDAGRPTVDIDPAMLASLVQQSVTIPITLADLELDDDQEPPPPIDPASIAKQSTQPLPQFDAEPVTFLRIDVRSAQTQRLPPTTQKLPQPGTEGTGTIANCDTWFGRFFKKLSLA